MSSTTSYYKSLKLHGAIRRVNYNEVKTLLNDPEVVECTNDDLYPFQLACHMGYQTIVRLFLDCERPINYNAHSATNIHSLYYALSHIAVFRMLVDDPRVDVNVNMDNGRNCLHLSSAMKRSLEITKILLACERFRFENAVAVDREGYTPSQIHKRQNPNAEEVANLVDAFVKNPTGTRSQLRSELGGYPEFQAGELFAIVVLLCDDYLKIKEI